MIETLKTLALRAHIASLTLLFGSRRVQEAATFVTQRSSVENMLFVPANVRKAIRRVRCGHRVKVEFKKNSDAMLARDLLTNSGFNCTQIVESEHFTYKINRGRKRLPLMTFTVIRGKSAPT